MSQGIGPFVRANIKAPRLPERTSNITKSLPNGRGQTAKRSRVSRQRPAPSWRASVEAATCEPSGSETSDDQCSHCLAGLPSRRH
jgi:hypothetical protein